MADRFAALATFCAVVEAGGFAAAARRLRVSKALVSKRIGALEAGLGLELLQRSTRRVEPTSAGARFYGKAREALLRLEEAFEDAGDARASLSGLVRIAAPMTLGARYVAPAVAALLRRNPGLEASVELDDNAVEVAARGFDLGIRIGRRPADTGQVLRPIAESPRLVCCSPDYAARCGLPRSVAELAAHDGIGYSGMERPNLWSFRAPGEAEPWRVEMRCRFVANNGSAMVAALVAGIGLSVMPLYFVAEALRSGALVNALPGAVPEPEEIYAVLPPAQARLRRVRAVADAVAEHMREHLPRL